MCVLACGCERSICGDADDDENGGGCGEEDEKEEVEEEEEEVEEKEDSIDIPMRLSDDRGSCSRATHPVSSSTFGTRAMIMNPRLDIPMAVIKATRRRREQHRNVYEEGMWCFDDPCVSMSALVMILLLLGLVATVVMSSSSSPLLRRERHAIMKEMMRGFGGLLILGKLYVDVIEEKKEVKKRKRMLIRQKSKEGMSMTTLRPHH